MIKILRFFQPTIALFLLSGALPGFAGRATIRPTETRASHLGAMAVGMGSIMHMADYLRDYKGTRTAIYAYIKMDDPKAFALIRNLPEQIQIEDRMDREFWPQIALETERLSLDAFTKELAKPGSITNENVRMLARTIGSYRRKGKWVFIRPFSEMNDGTDFCPWEFAHKRFHNTPEQFAAAWKLLREVFDADGATNAIFIFSPLAAYGVHHEPQTLAALNLIPKGYIDAFGLNIYSRPLTAYGGKSPKPVPFSELATPWIHLVDSSNHRGIPLAVSEMAVSNQAADVYRAEWLRYAFQFTRSHGFVLATYFNYPHRYWTLKSGSVAGWTLAREMTVK